MYENALSTLDPALETCSAVEPEQAKPAEFEPEL